MEEIAKQEFLELVRNLSHVELKKFNKNEYKKRKPKNNYVNYCQSMKIQNFLKRPSVSLLPYRVKQRIYVKDCVNAHPQERMCCRTQSYKILI